MASVVRDALLAIAAEQLPLPEKRLSARKPALAMFRAGWHAERDGRFPPVHAVFRKVGTNELPGGIVGAFFMALAIYSYLAARLLPLVLVAFVTLQWLVNRHIGKLENENLQILELSQEFLLKLAQNGIHY